MRFISVISKGLGLYYRVTHVVDENLPLTYI